MVSDFFENSWLSIQRGLPKREWDWQAVVLTVILIQFASTRLSITEWVPSLNIVIRISFYAVILGLIIGYSSLTRRNAAWVGIEYGLLLLPIQLLKAIETTDVLHVDLRSILIRLFDSMVFLFNNQPVYDTLFFLTLVSIGFWAIGVHAGYAISRHMNFLKTVIPPGLVMLIIQIYDPWVPRRIWALAFYIFFALALLGRCNLVKNKDAWKTKRVFRTSDSEWDISRSAMSFAALAVFAAWVIPSALKSFEPLKKAWREYTHPIEDKLSNTVTALDSPYGAPSGGDFYSSSLGLGNNAPVSETVVFYVEPKQVPSEPVRYYWRGRVYDHYENGQWTSTNITRRNFDPETDEVPMGVSPFRSEAKFTVTMNFPRQELIYAPSEMIWVDRTSRLVATSFSESDVDVNAWMAAPGLVAGDSYQVRAKIANPSIDELRSAGTEYPAWVTDRYLQVPAELYRTFQTLADKVAGSYITPYDKAQAVTAYLRKEIQYTTKLIDTPPSFQDPIVWVLFEYKQGFCMYYASAEVLMLRTLGIPARMAVGFSEGEFEIQKDRYAVAQIDSHAWPEVYFPNIGWVEFEPTGNQTPLSRPQQTIEEDVTGLEQDGSANNPDSNIPEDNADNPNNDPTLREDEIAQGSTQPIDSRTRFLYWGLILAFLTVSVFIVQRFSFADRLPIYLEGRYAKSGQRPPTWIKRWAKWAILTPIERAFHIIDLSLRWHRSQQPIYATPLERANRLGELIPSAQEAITTLEREHETILFTGNTGSLAAARKAAWIIFFQSLRKLILERKRGIAPTIRG